MEGVSCHRHILRINKEGFRIPGVVDKHNREILFIWGSQCQAACVAVDAGGGMLIVRPRKRVDGSSRNSAPDIVLAGIAVLPSGLGKFRKVFQHGKRRVIVDVAAPGIPCAQQFLVAVLDAFVEGADGRLENIMGTAGGGKGSDKAVHQCQRALVAADAVGAISNGLIFLQFRIAKGGAALAVPYFLVVRIRHAHIVVGGIGTVMEANDVYGMVEILVSPHIGDDFQPLILIGGNDADSLICCLGCRVHVIWEICLALYAVGEPFDKCIVWVPSLVLVWVYEVHNIAIFLISVKNGLFIPFVHGFIALVVGIVVPFFLYPVGHLPAQDANLHIGVDLLGVRRHHEAWGAGSIRRFALIAHGAGLSPCGVVAVIAHFHFDMGK